MLALPLGRLPVFHADLPAEPRLGVARHVAGRPDIRLHWCAGARPRRFRRPLPAPRAVRDRCAASRPRRAPPDRPAGCHSRAPRPADEWRAALASRWKRTPFVLVELLHEAAYLRAHDTLERHLSRLTTSTSRLRARSEAATSSPMKLEPMTTARRALLAAAMMACASASDAQSLHVRQRGALDRQPQRLRARRQQQFVVGKSAPALQRDRLALRVELDDGLVADEIRCFCCLVELIVAQPHPLHGRRAGEKILAEVGPVDGSRRFVADRA